MINSFSRETFRTWVPRREPFVHLNMMDNFDLPAEIVNGVRFYTTPNGDHYPSITSALSLKKQKSLENWRKRVGEENAKRKMERAADRGTKFHSVCEDYLHNKTPDYPDVLTKMLFGYARKTLDRIDNIHAIEQALYSKILKCAGRCDLIAEFDGKISIIDFKTSEEIKKREWIDSYFLQATFYSACYYELKNIKADNLVILMVAENGEVEVFQEKVEKSYLVEVKNQIAEFTRHIKETHVLN